MGFFQWLGSLLDDLVDWLGQAARTFLNSLLWSLQKIWETTVSAILYAAFGLVSILYVIFYAGVALGETIMEIWDPNKYNTKPSEIFRLKQAPQDSPLPKVRSESKVLTLENWH
ncbi:hypothetical protein DOP62_14135 (plasmid) [Synechococcus elongatus PCC 11801]|uniref:Uncharacterized protein n=1 Tax=Synechococcus elongatus PCC 11801 TaxID=2219813 RepID=A0ACD5A337_SYNEL